MCNHTMRYQVFSVLQEAIQCRVKRTDTILPGLTAGSTASLLGDFGC